MNTMHEPEEHAAYHDQGYHFKSMLSLNRIRSLARFVHPLPSVDPILHPLRSRCVQWWKDTENHTWAGVQQSSKC